MSAACRFLRICPSIVILLIQRSVRLEILENEALEKRDAPLTMQKTSHHGHQLIDDPFAFTAHLKSSEESRKLTGTPLGRKLIQFFFAHHAQLDVGARFVADWLIASAVPSIRMRISERERFHRFYLTKLSVMWLSPITHSLPFRCTTSPA
jgi:hypothetical protein